MLPYSIPAHVNCINCGLCCGLIPATVGEVRTIRDFLDLHPEARELATRQSKNMLHCPFRDDTKQSCSVYPVRPLVCRLMGVCKGMQCANGNTIEMDFQHVVPVQEQLAFLNTRDWLITSEQVVMQPGDMVSWVQHSSAGDVSRTGTIVCEIPAGSPVKQYLPARVRKDHVKIREKKCDRDRFLVSAAGGARGQIDFYYAPTVLACRRYAQAARQTL